VRSLLILLLSCQGIEVEPPSGFGSCDYESSVIDRSDERVVAMMAGLPTGLLLREVILPESPLPERWEAVSVEVEPEASREAHEYHSADSDCKLGIRVPVRGVLTLHDGTELAEMSGLAEADLDGVAWMRVGGEVDDDDGGAAMSSVEEVGVSTLSALRPELVETSELHGVRVLVDGRVGTIRVWGNVHDLAGRQGWYSGLLLDSAWVGQ